MLLRVLEPEVMDTEQDASEYDAIDNADVNREFALQALSVCPGAQTVLDLGTGTAQIPIQLALLNPELDITAVDLAQQMLVLAKRNLAAAGVSDRVRLEVRDVKTTGFAKGHFDLVICNSVIHHLPDPVPLFREIARLLGPETGLLVKDLARPESERQLADLVNTYAGSGTPYQQKLFSESLRAALTVPEVEVACNNAGLGPVSVTRVSDRHYCITRRNGIDT
jgi:ubiquinone/menaquinone biosynthesis C-methylase UbiE